MNAVARGVVYASDYYTSSQMMRGNGISRVRQVGKSEWVRYIQKMQRKLRSLYDSDE